jgi:hypothetical protein
MVSETTCLSASLSNRIQKQFEYLPARSSVLVVSSLLFALVVSVTSSLVQVLESLVGVVEGGFGLGDVVVNAGQLGLDVSQIGLGSEEGHAQKVAGSLVSLDSLVLSESLQIKGIRNLVEQLVAQFDDSFLKLLNYIHFYLPTAP